MRRGEMRKRGGERSEWRFNKMFHCITVSIIAWIIAISITCSTRPLTL